MFRILFCVFAFTIGAAQQAKATGSFIGNGADKLSDEWYSAWSLGDHVVSWCIHNEGSIGIDNSLVVNEISRAMLQWKDYLHAKGLDVQAKDSIAPALIFQSKYQSECNDTTNITFYLGFKNPEIEKWIEKYNDPIAFSRATHYDLEKGIGRGYVWIRAGSAADPSLPDWSHPANLRGIILHELGHVLGCRHIPGTIMDTRIADVILSNRFPESVDLNSDFIANSFTRNAGNLSDAEQKNYDRIRSFFLEHIDFSNELYFLPTTGATLFNHETLTPTQTATPYLVKMYERLTGEQPKGGQILVKFMQWRGDLKGTYTFASLYMTDLETINAAKNNMEDPRVWRFDMAFVPVAPELTSSISPEMVFKKNFKGRVYPSFSLSSMRFGKIILVNHLGTSKQVDWNVSYQRNRGKFDFGSSWDPVMVQLVVDFGTANALKMFRAGFRYQMPIADSSLNQIGGRLAPPEISSGLLPFLE